MDTGERKPFARQSHPVYLVKKESKNATDSTDLTDSQCLRQSVKSVESVAFSLSQWELQFFFP